MTMLRLVSLVALVALAACNSTPIVRTYSSSAGIPRHVRLTRTTVKLVTADMLPLGVDGGRPTKLYDLDAVPINVLSARDRELQGIERVYVLLAPLDPGFERNPIDNVDITRAAFIGIEEAKLLKREFDGFVADWDRDDTPGQRTFFALSSTSEPNVAPLSEHVVVDSPSIRLYVNRSGRSEGKPAALFLFHRERVGGGFEDHRLSLTEKGKVARFANMLGVAIADLEAPSPGPPFGPGASGPARPNPVSKP